jgi:hypothetical protein
MWFLVVSASACASRPPAVPTAPAAPPSTRDIEALIERGCFKCLEEALARADQRGQPALAFEAAALLALRATELGMPADEWMTRAKTLAADDPERGQYIEMVLAVPPDPLRGLRDDLLVETQLRRRIEERLTSVASWYDAVQTGAHSIASNDWTRSCHDFLLFRC